MRNRFAASANRLKNNKTKTRISTSTGGTGKRERGKTGETLARARTRLFLPDADTMKVEFSRLSIIFRNAILVSGMKDATRKVEQRLVPNFCHRQIILDILKNLKNFKKWEESERSSQIFVVVE